MIFAGIDFGWQGKPSGLALLDESAQLLELGRIAPLTEILQWVDDRAGAGPAMIAVDAPLVIVNPSGMRAADRLMHVHYGRFHAGCYPANLALPHARLPLALSAALQSRGFRHAAAIAPGAPGRFQIEVHPHAASVNLFGLPRILKYKKGRLAERRPELARYRRLLQQTFGAHLPAVPRTGPAMKDLEDRLDALLAAYIGWRWWKYGAAGSQVHGSRDEGYIVVPNPEKIKTCPP